MSFVLVDKEVEAYRVLWAEALGSLARTVPLYTSIVAHGRPSSLQSRGMWIEVLSICLIYSRILYMRERKTRLPNGSIKNMRLYRIWTNMMGRCYNQKHQRYHYYGGRGITVCDRWLKFTSFQEDLIVSYLNHSNKFTEKNTTIDRIDRNKGYNWVNCRWATWKEQNMNREGYVLKYRPEKYYRHMLRGNKQ